MQSKRVKERDWEAGEKGKSNDEMQMETVNNILSEVILNVNNVTISFTLAID